MNSSKFQICVADPCWSFNDSLKMSSVARGASANYDTMSISKIKELPVNSVMDPDGAVLALWVPSSLLQEGLDVMNAWGFKQKQTYIWVKTKKSDVLSKQSYNLAKQLHDKIINKVPKAKILSDYVVDLSKSLGFGMGHLFRQTHEICLIGINNNKIYKSLHNKSQRSVSFFQNDRHSKKPELLQDSLDLMFDGTNKLELFARRQRKGYVCIGNETVMTVGQSIDQSLLILQNKDINQLMRLTNGPITDLVSYWNE